jgi:cytochrome c556
MRVAYFVACAMLAVASTAFADDQETVDYRVHVMKTMAEQLAVLGQMQKSQIAPTNLTVHTEILALTATTAKSAFTPKVTGGKAKPEVWANWPDFSKRLDELVAVTADMDRAAKAGGLAAAVAKMQSLPCKGCHDNFRKDDAKPAEGAATPAAASDKNKAIIDYREHVMKTLNEQSGALGQILSTVVPDTNTAAHIHAIALAASVSTKAFEPKVPGGEAKPEVWSNWPDFSKRMNEFAQKTDEMDKLAKSSGNEAALAMVVDALSCKSCHDNYRVEKEKKK